MLASVVRKRLLVANWMEVKSWCLMLILPEAKLRNISELSLFIWLPVGNVVIFSIITKTNEICFLPFPAERDDYQWLINPGAWMAFPNRNFLAFPNFSKFLDKALR